jgi:hypothetical protein
MTSGVAASCLAPWIALVGREVQSFVAALLNVVQLLSQSNGMIGFTKR